MENNDKLLQAMDKLAYEMETARKEREHEVVYKLKTAIFNKHIDVSDSSKLPDWNIFGIVPPFYWDSEYFVEIITDLTLDYIRDITTKHKNVSTQVANLKNDLAEVTASSKSKSKSDTVRGMKWDLHRVQQREYVYDAIGKEMWKAIEKYYSDDIKLLIRLQ